MRELVRFVAGLAADLLRSRAGLVAKNGPLRQQLIVAERSLSAVCSVAALHDGAGRGLRAGLALRRPARSTDDDPPMAASRVPLRLVEALARPPTHAASLSRQMAATNPRWGAERIR